MQSDITTLFPNGVTKECHIQQLQSAEEIQHAFQTSRYVSLFAEMGSGKTNTFLEVAVRMLFDLKVNDVYIICGASENGLQDQVKQDTENCLHREDAHPMRNALLMSFKTFTKANIHVLFSNDLKQANDKKHDMCNKNVLIIWDEAHYAEKKDNRPFKWLKRNGFLPVLWGEKPERSNEVYLLTVTATPAAQFIDARRYFNDGDAESDSDDSDSEEIDAGEIERINNFHKKHVIISAERANEYYGVREFWQNKQIQANTKYIDEDNPIALEELLQNHKDEAGYIILRDRMSKHYPRIKQFAEKLGLGLKHYVQSKKKAHREYECDFQLHEFKKKPTVTTIVFVQGLLTMGHVLPKKHVLMVMEMSARSNDPSILQGLLGRMCGYPESPTEREAWANKRIYVPEERLQAIGEYATDPLTARLVSDTVSVDNIRQRVAKIQGSPFVPFVVRYKDVMAAQDNDEDNKNDATYNDLPDQMENISDASDMEAKRALRLGVFKFILDNPQYVNVQKPDTREDFLNTMRQMTDDAKQKKDSSCVYFCRNTTNGEHTYSREMPRIMKHVEENRPCGMGINFQRKQVVLMHCDNNYAEHSLLENDIIVCGVIPKRNGTANEAAQETTVSADPRKTKPSAAWSKPVPENNAAEPSDVTSPHSASAILSLPMDCGASLQTFQDAIQQKLTAYPEQAQMVFAAFSVKKDLVKTSKHKPFKTKHKFVKELEKTVLPNGYSADWIPIDSVTGKNKRKLCGAEYDSLKNTQKRQKLFDTKQNELLTKGNRKSDEDHWDFLAAVINRN